MGFITPHCIFMWFSDKNIIQKLVNDWDYIDIEKKGQSFYVGLTTDGMAFVYEMTP